MKLIRPVVSVVLAIVMSLSLASCSNTTWVAEYNGEKVPVGIYTYYTLLSLEQLLKYSQIDSSIRLGKQTVGDKSVEDYVRDIAIDNIKNYLALKELFEKAGLVIDEENLNALKLYASSEYSQYGTALADNGVAVSSVLEASSQGKTGMMAEMLFEHMYGIGGTEGITLESLKTRFLDNYVRYTYISKKLTDSDNVPLTDEGKSKVRDEFTTIKETVLGTAKDENGNPIAQKPFSEFVTEYQKNQESEQNTLIGVQGNQIVMKNDTDLMKKLLEIPIGTIDIIELDNTLYIINRLDPNESSYFDNEDNQLSILQDWKSEEFYEFVEKKASEIDVKLNNSAVKKFGLKKFNFKAFNGIKY